ncbi:COG4223 family protein [Methylocella sp.]|uniref:COG4223 family protein n=1 Tax=Methylocella sp. TaxID=1978226 RepID=UPI0035ADB6AA
MAEEKDESVLPPVPPEEAPASEAPPPVEPPPAVAPPAAAAAPSRAPLLIGALVLGVLGGLGGGAALRYLEADGSDPLAEMNARTLDLEKKAAAAATAVSALQGRVAAAENAARGAGSEPGASASAAAAVAAVAAAKEAAEKADAAARRAESVGADLAAKAAAAVDSTKEPASPAPDLGPVESRVDDVASRLQGLESRVAARFDAMMGKLGAVETQVNAPKIDEGARKELETAAEAQKRRDALHARALMATMLRDHVDSGAPYEADLLALQNLGVDAARLAPLRARAKAGAPTAADLAESFSRLAPTLELTDPPQEAGVIDRLKHDALALVRVRREAEPSDADIPGRLAAIGAALKRGDVAGAYALWTQLPESLKAKSADWGDLAKARLDAVAAANAIEADAATALSKSPS